MFSPHVGVLRVAGTGIIRDTHCPVKLETKLPLNLLTFSAQANPFTRHAISIPFIGDSRFAIFISMFSISGRIQSMHRAADTKVTKNRTNTDFRSKHPHEFRFACLAAAGMCTHPAPAQTLQELPRIFV